MVASTVEGVLLDSGDTLIRPIGGSWYTGPRFRRLLAQHGLAGLDPTRLDAAVAVGLRWVGANLFAPTEEDERVQLQAFYRIVLTELGLIEPPEALTLALAAPDPAEALVEPFPETRAVLERLRARGLALGIVSNAGPSLDRFYRQLGLRRYFDAFAVSACLGVAKPDRRIFERAIADIGLPPASLLFVDDWHGYVAAAIALGLRGVVLRRDGQPPPGGLPWIRDLTEVERWLE